MDPKARLVRIGASLREICRFDGHRVKPLQPHGKRPNLHARLPDLRRRRRDLIETAVGRIANAVAAAPAGSLRIVQIKEKFAGLRLYWQSAGLSDEIKNAVEEAVGRRLEQYPGTIARERDRDRKATERDHSRYPGRANHQ